MRKSVYVVGAGIIGLASAYKIAQSFPDCDVTIGSADYHPNTTSDHAGGIVNNRDASPQFITDDSRCYILDTKKHCQSMKSDEANAAGIRLRETIIVSTDQEKMLDSVSAGVDFQLLTTAEIKALGYDCENSELRLIFGGQQPHELYGCKGYTYIIDTSQYLPWLTAKLKQLKNREGRPRVEFVTRKISNLNELNSHDLIINCSGHGAKELVKDEACVPVKGQYVLVKAPDMKKFITIGKAVFIPRCEDLYLGSVHLVGEANEEIDPRLTELVLRRCEAIYPDVRKAEILKVGVGIRPGRIGGSRVELEYLQRAAEPRKVPVIHNYGHGATGISQHWGCALKVARLARQALAVKAKI